MLGKIKCYCDFILIRNRLTCIFLSRRCGGARHQTFTEVVNSLALQMPATVTICQQITSALIEPLRRDELPVNLQTTLDFDQLSMQELVDVTTRDLVFRKAGQEGGAQDPDHEIAQQLQDVELRDIEMDDMEPDQNEADSSEMEIDDGGIEDA